MEATKLAQINLGQAQPGDLLALNNRIHHYHAIRHSRIPAIARDLLRAYRERWYAGIGQEAPDLILAFPAPAGT